MAETGGKGRKRLGTTAKKAKAIPLFVAKMPHAMIAELLQVSERTVARWAGSEDVRQACGDIVAETLERTKDEAAGIASKAVKRLQELLDSDDERIALDATKTTLDRFGYPVRSEQAVETSGSQTVLVMTPERAAQVAKERDE